MERLISSFSTRTPLPRSPLLVPRVAGGGGRSSLGPLRRECLKPAGALFSKQEGLPRPPPPPLRPLPQRSSSSFIENFSVIRSEEKAGKADPSSQLAERIRHLAGPCLKKVASAAATILLPALISIIIQPILAPPAYATVQSAAKTGGKFIKAELLSSAWTGLFAGCLHTLSGPDHLAALAPLSIGRTRVESAIVGALWGCGHDAGQVIFGLLFLLLKDRLHIEVIRTWGTRVVGLTLLVIGAMGIREATEVTPCVALENGECDVSIVEPLQTAPSGKKKIGFATFATGIVHGLQPDALMMVLPALALPSRLAGAAFLGMFLVGTVLAMGSYTVFIGSCSQALKDRVPRITEKLTWAASLVAIFMGVAILVSQVFGFSLY
ncbi:uncharacterized protein LOC103719597 [Phoenix dactylifera]|uniref:Uncharacterized protein LOC103719597 n=1 Tax=Phoenix dactylifera TaxID=42345 RepID=A0A8B7CV03_PHODC|nr:uncharacterized protein LOC103719597 [Phoenix dactylifera]